MLIRNLPRYLVLGHGYVVVISLAGVSMAVPPWLLRVALGLGHSVDCVLDEMLSAFAENA